LNQYPRGTIAVVGAGMAGSTAAGHLAARGFDVTVFEKGRGPGGRMATRRDGGYEFDHGAPYFTTGDDAFADAVAGWVDAGVVSPWRLRLRAGDGGTGYVAVPGMNALCRYLGRAATFISRVPVTGARRAGRAWHLQGEYASDLGEFDALIVTAPPKQTALLLPQASGLRRQMRAVTMTPRWAVMAAFEHPVEVEWDVAEFEDGPVERAVRNSAKPGRPQGEAWVLHAGVDWTRTHLEGEPAGTAERLLHEFFAAIDVPRPRLGFISAHRWRYATADKPLSDGFLWDSRIRVGVCADWCCGGTVGGAWQSGMGLAERLVRSFQ
jgi:predicted NAD/FAD-dependent oxidoreductase